MSAVTPELESRIAKWRKLADAYPDNELPRISLGQAYLEAKRYDEAERTFGEVNLLQPDHMTSWIHRGQALMSLGRFEEARDLVKKGLELAVAQGHTGPRADCEMMLEEIAEELGA